MIYGIEFKEVPHRVPSRAILDADMLRIILWLLFATSTSTIRIHLRLARLRWMRFYAQRLPTLELAMPALSYETRSAPLPAPSSLPNEVKTNTRMWASAIHDGNHWPYAK